MPDACRGDWVRIARRDGTLVDAEVIAFDEDRATLMPLGSVHGIGPDDEIRWMGNTLTVPCGRALLGRVVDGIGRPLDGGPALQGEPWPIVRAAPAAFDRPRISRVFPTGVRAIDALCTIGEGQRIGLFAPAGVGKTSLLGRIAQHSAADVIVTCLVGERGRELNEHLEGAVGVRARSRSVVVCSTSDASALERMKSAQLATTFAEYFRAQGLSVLLLIDSLTRLVRAAREVGLAAGEPPARRGFPPSAFSELAPLLERAGLTKEGEITAFYTVLVEGNDPDEPVADEVRGLLDGHLVLERALAQSGHYPPIDVTKSLSRLMHTIVSATQQQAAERVRTLLSHYESKRDLVELGAVQPGADVLLDRALSKLPAIHALLKQERADVSDYASTLERLHAI
ncbi:MAG: Flagellum-specific synthase FliI [Myxococcaceae bacterium]|nr:Flagellum-specific synthase FliI [Myxococcaceae bacterium]